MKSIATFRFVFAMLVATGLLISAFILLFSYSSDKGIKENILDNRSVKNISAQESASKANSDLSVISAPVDSSSNEFSQKSKKPFPAADQNKK
jgi:hypothetical protein